MPNKWISYKNGNYVVYFNTEDGTKVRETDKDDFIPSFAENCDCKITDRCDNGCEFCYEGCTKDGRHGDILNYKFLDTLHPYTELAINGNDLTHPDLVSFLKMLSDKKVITNMTVNQNHFMQHYKKIKKLIDKKLIYGLGVSLVDPNEEFIQLIKGFPTAVIHVINGILTAKDIESLADNDLKLLILGYKQLRRGCSFYDKEKANILNRQKWLYDNLSEVLEKFEVVSFDNLAIEQLNVRRLLSKEEWNKFYMGNDAEFTFYLDLVDGMFGKNSLAVERYPVMDSIDDMFEKIRRTAV